MSEHQKGQEQKKKKEGGRRAAVVIIALIAVVTYLLLSPGPGERQQAAAVAPENAENVSGEGQEEEASEYYTVTMNQVWHFKTGDSESYDGVVINDEENAYDVYFDVVLEEDQSQVLYSSPVLPLGGQLDKIKLDKTLEAGTYNCIVNYHLLDEEQNTLNTLQVNLQIVIEG